eukprot:scaffold149734_cov13-Tisochrysis_lutea.AAC.1
MELRSSSLASRNAARIVTVDADGLWRRLEQTAGQRRHIGGAGWILLPQCFTCWIEFDKPQVPLQQQPQITCKIT